MEFKENFREYGKNNSWDQGPGYLQVHATPTKNPMMRSSGLFSTADTLRGEIIV